MLAPSLSATAPSATEGTRQALIAAGIRLFGQQGFSATSVRQLAQEAGANIAAITYHFGGKDGLRLACAEDFGRRMSEAIGAAAPAQPPGPEAARAELRRIAARMVQFLLGGPAASDMVAFMLRELAEDGPGVDAAYHNLIEPMHRRLCGLWGEATSTAPESDAVRLSVFSLIGQIMYFRVGQTLVTRRMGWARLGAAEIDAITRRIHANLDAMLSTEGQG